MLAPANKGGGGRRPRERYGTPVDTRRSGSQADLDAAQDIIQNQRFVGLSAREVARRIEYSPGTIYNMFENLDDVVLHVEARVLDALDKRLSAVLADGDSSDRVGRLARPTSPSRMRSRGCGTCCLSVCPPRRSFPPGIGGSSRVMGKVEEAMAPLFPAGQEAERQRPLACCGPAFADYSLSTADKLSVVTTETASRLVGDLVATYLAGLAARSSHARERLGMCLPLAASFLGQLPQRGSSHITPTPAAGRAMALA